MRGQLGVALLTQILTRCSEKNTTLTISLRPLFAGREGVKWELGFAFFGLGKWDLLHWDWDLITGTGI